MSQPSAVASASFARSSPRCQLWTSLPRFPSGFSRLWSGPATKPSSEIDMWQVVSGIGVLQVIAIRKRKTLGLKARREELGAETPEEHKPLSDEDPELPVAHVREVIAGGDPPARKALLQSLVEEISVVSRAEIYPSFLLPAFDHREGQCPRQESNLDLPLLLRRTRIATLPA